MSKEVSEKKKTNPLVYILGIPLGILILVIAYIQWQKYQDYRYCVDIVSGLNYQYNQDKYTSCRYIFGIF